MKQNKLDEFINGGRGVGRLLKIWNFQGCQNSMWNFQGLIKNEVEFPRVTKKK